LNNLYFPGKVQNNQEIIIAFNFVAEVGKDWFSFISYAVEYFCIE
jgi:hypothetical protein